MKKVICNISEAIATFGEKYIPTARKIWKSYGYYISLACLLTLFGITAYMYRTDNTTEAVMTSGRNIEYKEASTLLSATPSPSPAPTPFAPHFSIPVDGSITSAYSPDQLIWNETLGQWIVHNGMDISANAGTVVTASETGVVSAAYEDDMYGLTIEICHEDGWITRYRSLETLKLVEVGTAVNKGDAISSIGTSALTECTYGPHLHFEVLKDGKYTEPIFD